FFRGLPLFEIALYTQSICPMRFKSNWSVRVRCNSPTQALRTTQALLRRMQAEPDSIHSSRFPATNLAGVTRASNDRSGFELKFELFHDQPEFERALQEVLRMASAASRRWELYFRPMGSVEGKTGIPGSWTPTVCWSVSPNDT